MKETFFKILLLLLALCLCLGALALLYGGGDPRGELFFTQEKSITMNKYYGGEECEVPIIRAAAVSDPRASVLRVLMIGNSFCYYFPDELYGIAKAAGIDMEIGNVYYSGCSLKKHWTWLVADEANYDFILTGKDGRKTTEEATLRSCIEARDWDVITLQQHFSPRAQSLEGAWMDIEPYAENLITFLRETAPEAKLFWHQTWAYQIGYDSEEYGSILTAEAQTAQYQNIRAVSVSLCDTYGLPRIPSGDAWQLAREDPAVGDVLCGRDGGPGDFYHDGDTGGGQYLNACVWFEVLTGKSCVGNTFRPSYNLSEEKIAALQQAAHQAVADQTI